jgi:hypothetical protein
LNDDQADWAEVLHHAHFSLPLSLCPNRDSALDDRHFKMVLALARAAAFFRTSR